MIGQKLAGQILKAAYSGTVACLGMLSTLLTGDATFSSITDGQWVSIALFTLAAIGGTFGLSGWSGPKINGASQDG